MLGSVRPSDARSRRCSCSPVHSAVRSSLSRPKWSASCSISSRPCNTGRLSRSDESSVASRLMTFLSVNLTTQHDYILHCIIFNKKPRPLIQCQVQQLQAARHTKTHYHTIVLNRRRQMSTAVSRLTFCFDFTARDM